MDQKTIKVKVFNKIILTNDTSLKEITDKILFAKIKGDKEDTIVVLQKDNLVCPKCGSEVGSCGSQIGGKKTYSCKNEDCKYRFTPSENIPKMRYGLNEIIKGLRRHKENKIPLRKISGGLRDECVFISYNGVWKWEKITTKILKALMNAFEFQNKEGENARNTIKDGDLKFLVKNIKFLILHNKLTNYLIREGVVTWEQLKKEFEFSKSTLWRRLQNTELVTSLNHNREYIARKEIVEKNVDENGIWRINDTDFSTLDSLESIILNIIEKSDAGCDVAELESYLSTSPKQKVVDLFKKGKIKRAKFGYKYVYFSPTKSEEQIKARIELDPEGGIKLNADDVKKAARNVGEILKKIVKESMEYVGMEDKDMPRVDILMASFMKPLKHIDSDRHLARYLKNNPSQEGFYDFKESPEHSTISDVKKEFGKKGQDFVFRSMVMWILKKLDIKELTIAIDTTHAFKSQNNKWGIKIHIAGMHPFGIPIAFTLMEGKAHDTTTLEEIIDIVLSYGIKIKFVIGDGAYDNSTFYYVVTVKAKAEGIARYNPRRSEFKDKPTDSTLIEYLKKMVEEYDEAKKRDKHRGGPIRKNEIPKGIILSNYGVQGEILRNFPLTDWNSDERNEIYKHRTLVERINSILKLWLGLENLRTYSDDAREFNIYSSFISLLIVSMLAIELGVPEAMLRVSLWNM